MKVIRVTRADASMKDAVTALWKATFGDSTEWIESFLSAASLERTCFAALSGKNLAGMLFSLPAVLTVNGEAKESRYIYAVATDPEFRNQGVMTALERFACEEAAKEGAFYAALVPAAFPLFSMYQKLGYRTAFHEYTARAPMQLDPQAKLSHCSPEFFFAERRRLLSERSVSFELYPNMQEFRCWDLVKSGKLVRARTADAVGYVVFEKREDTLVILETSLPDHALSHAAGTLCEEQHCSTITVKGKTGTAAPFGMLKPLFKEKSRNLPIKIDGYMGLMLN